MSKLGCSCGYAIRDQTDFLPYKGQVLKDQDHEAFFSGVAEALSEYVAAVRSDDLAEWHRKWSCVRTGAPDESVMWGILGWFWRKFKVDVYQCDNCGRLWVQADTRSNRFIPFVPEEPSAGNLLASEHFGETG